MLVGDYMEKIYSLINSQIQSGKKVIIAIDGPCTSGKSTLGDKLSKKYSALLFHTDDYFLHPSRKTKERLSQSGGNFDFERMKLEIFDNLYEEVIVSNHFNCSTNQMESRSPKNNTNVIVVEGSYSLHSTLFDYYTLKILLTIDPQTQLERISKRNGIKMLDRFVEEWIPMENSYFIKEDLQNRVDYTLKLDI